MYDLIRALLFRLEPELAHRLTLTALTAFGRLPGAIRPHSGRSRTVMGLEFRNPVGLAAGLDKNAVAVEGLARLGFGFIEVGTVTPRPQPGNPSPRVFRLPERRALINRLGFNNAGVDEMARRLDALRNRDRLSGTVLGVNIGKNRDTPLPDAAQDYLACMDAVYRFADYLTVNLSSPNTPGLRSLQSGEALHALLDALLERRELLAGRHRRNSPLVLKIAPDLGDDELSEIAEAALTRGIDAIIATNTTVARPEVAGLPHADESGGLSGEPLGPLARRIVEKLSARLQGRVPIIGAGGTGAARHGRAMLQAGASLLQIYTGFVYEGPALIRALARLR